MIRNWLLFILIGIYSFSNLYSQKKAPFDTLSSDSSIYYYNSILMHDKKSCYANLGIASALYQKGLFKESLKYSKKNLKQVNEFQAESFLIHASTLDRLGRIDQAINEFQKALKLYPNNYQLWYEYAISCYKYREHEKSIKALEKVIILQPLFVPAHYLYGCTLFENSNDKACVAAFLFGLMLDNDTLRSKRAIAFIINYLHHQPERINIPFFDKRLTIYTVDHILYYYFPHRDDFDLYKNVEIDALSDDIDSYLISMKDIKPEVYVNFYKSLSNENLIDVFSHYVIRCFGSPYNKIWIKSNSKKLAEFAKFLEKNLP